MVRISIDTFAIGNHPKQQQTIKLQQLGKLLGKSIPSWSCSLVIYVSPPR